MLSSLLLLHAALAARPSCPADGPWEAVSAGDRAWYAGELRLAVACFRLAARGEEPAARAMAHLRLLAFSGNLGMALHGPAAERALAACGEGPRCALARADYELFAPPEVGADPRRVPAELGPALDALPGPAAARLYLATGEASWRERLAGLERDGLAEGVLATGGPPPRPGSPYLGLGLLAGPGLGVGAGLHLEHPNLGRRGLALRLDAAATSRGAGLLSLDLAGPGRLHGLLRAAAARQLVDLYAEDGSLASTLELGSLSLAPGLGLREGPWTLRLGPSAWTASTPALDACEGGCSGLGPWTLLARDDRHLQPRPGGGRLALSLDSTLLGDTRDLLLRGDARLYRPLGERGLLALGLFPAASPLPDPLPWREPAAGGAVGLRGAPLGRFRGPLLVAGALELRRELSPPFEGVAFLEGAWVQGQGAHPSGGLGLRFRPPPDHAHALRLDLAASDAGWALLAGWGEAF